MNNFYLQDGENQNIDELIGLAKTNYSSGDIINSDYINWQYNENPFGKPLMSIARESSKNEVVGQYLVIPLEYIIEGHKKTGSLSLNTLTREDFRGKGLFTQMAFKTYDLCSNQNISFTVGYPNPQSFPGFIKKLNFSHAGDIPLLIKPLKPFKIFLNKIANKKEKHGSEIELEFEGNQIFSIFNFDNDKDKYLTFWDAYSQGKEAILNKTFEFLDWRYKKNPTKKYKIIKGEIDNKIHALIIVRAEKTLGSRTVVIMDYMVLKDKLSIITGKKLLKYSIKEFKKNSIEMMAVLSQKNDVEHAILKDFKFYKVPEKLLPQPIPYIVRINQEEEKINSILKLQNWQVCFGDYDIF